MTVIADLGMMSCGEAETDTDIYLTGGHQGQERREKTELNK